jgi:hypothetical protein
MYISPLQKQENFSSFSDLQSFCRTVRDASENYFVGYRGEETIGTVYDSWALTAVRISSFATVFIPAIVGAAFVVSSFFIKAESEVDWESKVHVPFMQEQEIKPKVVKMLSRSGIKKTEFTHIFFMPSGKGGSRIFEDGAFSSLSDSIKETDKILVVALYDKFKFKPNKVQVPDGQNEAYYYYFPMNKISLSLNDGFMASSTTPNRLKERLIVGFKEEGSLYKKENFRKPN